MERSKGFTLIELLAVIVILAIIALIVTPIITSVISNSKKSGFERSVDGLVDAAQTDYADKVYSGSVFYQLTGDEFSSNKDSATIKYTGDIGEDGEGTVRLTGDGDVAFAIHNNDYCATKDIDSKDIKISDYNGTCEGKLYITYQSYRMGDVNQDGKITDEDADMIIKADLEVITLTPIQSILADVNFDGNIDAMDASIIMQVIAGGLNLDSLYWIGDVNQDGKITDEDGDMIQKGYAGIITLTPAQVILADIDFNGTIQPADVSLCLKIIAGTRTNY